MRFAWVLLLCLAACGRPLTTGEMSFATTLYGDQLDPSRVRLVDGHFARSFTFRYAKRPRVTCQERIFPPVEEEIVTSSPAATTLFNRIFLRQDLFLEDYTEEFVPGTNLYALMLFAHEMAHVWQWQNRKRTHYNPLKAAQEHGGGSDPYLFNLQSDARFLDYPYEQQASIVEEFVCCRALAPKAARTGRLHDLLAQELPVARLQSRVDALAVVPWRGVQTRGICD